MQSMWNILWLQGGETEDFHAPGGWGFGGDLREISGCVAWYHTPEKACGTLSWSRVEVRQEHPPLAALLAWTWVRGVWLRVHITYTKTSWTIGSLLSTQAEMWSADMGNSVGHQRLMQKHSLPTEKEFTSLFSRCRQSLKWIALFPHLCHEGTSTWEKEEKDARRAGHVLLCPSQSLPRRQG